MSRTHTNDKGRPRAPFSPLPLLLALTAATATAAQDNTAPRLILPVACTLGDTCYIQQYVDRDPGPSVQDFTCGPLANDGHKGVDFAVPTEALMAEGIAVLAAADGVVRGLRDGMPDIRQGDPGAPDVSGVECGNGLLLDHGNGWETQYCHLREGSVAVSTGAQVRAGQPVGLIGMSGRASFPHVHVELRHDGTVIDPFSPDPSAPCGAAQAPLWETPPAYFAGGPVAAGFSDDSPTLATVEAGLPEDGLGPAPAVVVLWVYMANTRRGDTVAFDIQGPEGPVAAGETDLQKTQPLRMEGMGIRAPAAGFPPGSYTGTVIHRRDGAELGRRTVRAEIP